MAGQDSRVGERQTASMRIKLKYPDVETFVQKYAVNISRGGIFIATKQPKPVGTYVRFEFLLSDTGQTSIIRGEGQVQWTKDFDPAAPNKPHGMGVKFMRLDGESQAVVDRALKWRAEHGTSPGTPLPATGSGPNSVAARESSQAGRMPTERVPAQDPPTVRYGDTAPTLAARFGEDPPTARYPGEPPSGRFGEDPPTARYGESGPARYGEDPPTVPMGAEPPPARPAGPDDTTRLSAVEAAAVARGAEPSAPHAVITDEQTDRVSVSQAEMMSAPISSAPPPPPMALPGRQRRMTEPPREELPDVRRAPEARETRPIAIDHRDEGGRAPHETTREITLPEARDGRGTSDEIDSLAAEWGLSEEKVARVLKRARPRMVEATAELERLLLKPPKLPTPTKAEALTQLAALLSRKPRSNP